MNVSTPEYTYPFVGRDLRKIVVCEQAGVFDDLCNDIGNNIGVVLTYVTDMAIGYRDDRILSVASPYMPADFKHRGLSCGFVKVKRKLEFGDIIEIRDRRRKIRVRITKDIRPDRTARCPMSEML